ncbi:hypothetical protein evm_010088 [Chilo suppressalis]|nr:hypothetical protein evm_010088 [Chilo suppressalis]
MEDETGPGRDSGSFHPRCATVSVRAIRAKTFSTRPERRLAPAPNGGAAVRAVPRAPSPSTAAPWCRPAPDRTTTRTPLRDRKPCEY